MHPSKYNLLQELLIKARKSGDKSAIAIYSTMKGEIDNMLKLTPHANVEELIEKYALKSKKNLEEFTPLGYEKEIEFLMPFQPKQVSISEVNEFIKHLKNEGIKVNQWMGRIMKNFRGVDPQLVKELINKEG